MRVALPPEITREAFARCDPERAVQTLGGAALGTSWRVVWSTPDDTDPKALRRAIDQRFATIVAEMSQWENASLLSRFNRAPAGTWFALPPDFAAVTSCALDIAERSEGAFDPTHGRAAALMGYGAETISGPASEQDLDLAVSRSGWRLLDYDREEGRLRQPGGLWLDFSGIAKGHAVDMVGDLLAGLGIFDALIEIGGELSGRGLRPDGQPWWVDLETPPGTDVSPVRCGLHDNAVATSGNYVRGAHTIDPRTGRATRSAAISVSVIAKRCMHADAWATALTVLGAEQGMALALRENLATRCVYEAEDGVVECLSVALRQMIDD